MTEEKSPRFRDPPLGSAFTLSPEDLIVRGAHWDIDQESRSDTRRLIDNLTRALSKEREDRSVNARLLADGNIEYGQLETRCKKAEQRVVELEVALERSRIIIEQLGGKTYQIARVAERVVGTIGRRLRGR